jgi:hypothetical protein
VQELPEELDLVLDLLRLRLLEAPEADLIPCNFDAILLVVRTVNNLERTVANNFALPVATVGVANLRRR